MLDNHRGFHQPHRVVTGVALDAGAGVLHHLRAGADGDLFRVGRPHAESGRVLVESQVVSALVPIA